MLRKPRAFLEINFHEEVFRTTVKYGTMNPDWRDVPTIFFKVERKDLNKVLKSEKLVIKIFYEGIFSNTLIGHVEIDLISIDIAPIYRMEYKVSKTS
jgi:hypothetical protein